MVRLLWKELTYNWWLAFAACGVGIALMLSGDSVFWSDKLTLRSFWLMLVSMLLGLRAYSSELGGETVQFLGSRPIRWWQTWIAKLTAGLLQVVFVVIVCGVVYVLMAPAEYRSSMMYGLEEGFFRGIWLLSINYVFGFSASVLMPGVPQSLAPLVMMVIIMSAPALVLAKIGASSGNEALARFSSAMGDNTGVLCLVLAPIGSMVIARRLSALSASGRWAICIGFLLVASVLGGITAGIWGYIESSKDDPISSCISLSPDGRWAVYGVTKDDESHTYLIDTSNGQRRLELMDTQHVGCSWSADSCKLAYWGRADAVRVVTICPKPSFGPLVQVKAVRALGRPSESALSWSPRGDLLAVLNTYSRRDSETKYSIAVIRPDRDKAVHLRVAENMGVNALRSRSGDMPLLSGPNALFWPGGDGGRLTQLVAVQVRDVARKVQP